MNLKNDFIYYPVVIPTLCRFEHFKDCVESLKSCNDADKTEIIVGLDYPPSEKYLEGYNKIKEYLPTITGFKNIIIFEHKENLGSAKNSDFLKNVAMEKYDAVIYSEDDNIFAPTFLEFMNWGLNTYKNDMSVNSVCGYSYPIKWDENDDVIIKQNRYFSAWGVGMWKNRMAEESAIYCGEYFRKFLNQNDFLKKLYTSPRNLISYSDMLLCDSLRPYDITRSVYMFVSEKYQLMPSLSLVRNTGWDNSGEHCCHNELGNIFNNQKISVKLEFPVNSFFIKEPSEKVYTILEDFQMSICENSKKVFNKAKLKLFCIVFFGVEFMKKLKTLVKKG